VTADSIFRRFWQPKERRKHGRVYAHSAVKFRIVDSKNPTICSQMLQGKVFDISTEGLCIGTTSVQADGLHVFHPSSQHKNKLEMEVDLDPGMAPLRTFGEVQWYSRVKYEKGWIFKMGVTWLSLSESDRQILKKFLETKTI
jgi:hypothetical protein